MATKLNQIVAVEKGIKGKANRDFTDLYQRLGKAPLLSGISRTYQPKDDDGDRLPSEQTLVQTKMPSILDSVRDTLTALFDVTLTKDVANTQAKANITIDGTVLLADVPVSHLLFLEKQLTDLGTFISKIPTLDPAETWTYDEGRGVYVTDPTETHRTRKVPRAFVKAPATDKHPAQVEMFTEDEIVGYWRTIKFSGALPADKVKELLDRVETLQKAVKFAREEANTTEIEQKQEGEIIFDYLFGA